jgi:heme-degrading monooxygenase HmoA
MVARVSRIEMSPDKVEAAVAQFRDETLETLKTQEGFDGMTLLVDRASGVVLGTTFWESEELMTAAEAVGEDARRKTAEAGGATVEPTREVFDVAVVQTAQL